MLLSTMCLATEKANEWDEKGTNCAGYVLSSSIPATEIIFKILVRIVFQVTQGDVIMNWTNPDLMCIKEYVYNLI